MNTGSSTIVSYNYQEIQPSGSAFSDIDGEQDASRLVESNNERASHD